MTSKAKELTDALKESMSQTGNPQEPPAPATDNSAAAEEDEGTEVARKVNVALKRTLGKEDEESEESEESEEK